MSTASESNSLQVKRLIRAPRERVFAAWTEAAQIKNWFGPANCRVANAQIDLRVGGQYRFEVSSEEMGTLAVRGEYREVNAPSKLVFTWQWEDDEDWAGVVSTVTVEFAEMTGGTEVVITHTGLPSAESAGRHGHGWDGSLDKLAAGAAALAELCGPGRFIWNELLADDVESAAAFYAKLLGWEPVPAPNGMNYTLFKKDGNDVAGLMKLPMPGVPPHWLNYVNVRDVDASAAQVTALGGTICAPPFDIPNIGRIAVVQDPQGARFGLFQPTCQPSTR